MDDASKTNGQGASPFPASSGHARPAKWVFETDIVTDVGRGLCLRLERHIEKTPTQYRWSFGVLIPQEDGSLRFILGVRPWVDRKGGHVSVRDEAPLMMLLMQRMQEYIVDKEQLAEDEWRKAHPHHAPKGLKQWRKHDKERREARERKGGEGGA